MILITNATSKQTKAVSLLYFNFLLHLYLKEELQNLKEVQQRYESVFDEKVSYQTILTAHKILCRNTKLFKIVHEYVFSNIEKQPDEIYLLVAEKVKERKYWFSQRNVLLGAIRAVYYATLAYANYAMRQEKQAA